MQEIKEIQQEIIDDFELFDDWTDKYEYLIELGKDLPPISEKYKIDANLIKGCQSRVWLHAEKKNEKIFFYADSDAIMTRGIVALLIKVFSAKRAKEIATADLGFINKIGLTQQLSATRANGLASMLRQIKLSALALTK